MRRMFLYGILCGVMMAAAVTFLVAIPANNDHWRVEIVKRGGGTWYVDKNGHLGWMWTAQPVPGRCSPGKDYRAPVSAKAGFFSRAGRDE